MRLRFAALALLLAAVLTGCGLIAGPGSSITVHVEPTTLSFEYSYSEDESGTERSAEVTDSTVVFRNTAGGATATVAAYSVRYTYADGTPVAAGAYDFENDGLFSVVIPAGFSCVGEGVECFTSRTPEITSSEPVSVGLMNIELALDMIPAFPQVFAEVEFTVRQAGTEFLLTHRVSVVPTASGN